MSSIPEYPNEESTFMYKENKQGIRNLDLQLIAKLRFTASIWLVIGGFLLVSTFLFLNPIITTLANTADLSDLSSVFTKHSWQVFLLVINTFLLLFAFRFYDRTMKGIKEMM